MTDSDNALGPPGPDTAGRPDAPPRAWPAVALLLLAGLFAYCNSFTKGFVFDDLPWIVNNVYLKDVASFAGSEWAYARPLISWSLLLNYQLGGLAPFGYHLVNVAIHLGAGVLLYLVIRRVMARDWPEAAGDVAFAAALLWLVHPLQTQSVTYIIQRCESMMGLLFLLSFYCAVRGVDSPRPWAWGLGAVVSAAASEACKEVAAAIPLVVMAYDWVFVPGPGVPTLRRRWPLYVGLFAATWGVMFGLAVLPSSAPPSAGFAYKGIRPVEYLFTQPGVLLHYLRLSVWPSGQALDMIDWPLARTPGDWLPQGVVIVALLLGTFWALWRRWWPGFVGAWFFSVLGPTSSVVPIADVAFEHRMYLPLAALTVLAAVAGRRLLGPEWGGLALLAAAAALSAVTLARNEAYRNAYVMWAENVRVRPANARVLTSLSGEAQNRGLLEEAVGWVEEAEKGHADRPSVIRQRALLDLHQGRYAEAVRGLQEVQNRSRGHAQREASMHRAIGQAAFLGGASGLGEAEKSFRTAVELAPLDPLLRLQLALTLSMLGRAEEAETHRAEAVRLQPGVGGALERGARVSALAKPGEDVGLNRAARARTILDARLAAAATGGKEARPLDTLGIALAADGRFKEAAEAAAKALALSPDDAGIALRLRLYRAGKPYNRETARGAWGKKP